MQLNTVRALKRVLNYARLNRLGAMKGSRPVLRQRVSHRFNRYSPLSALLTKRTLDLLECAGMTDPSPGMCADVVGATRLEIEADMPIAMLQAVHDRYIASRIDADSRGFRLWLAQQIQHLETCDATEEGRHALAS